VEILTIPAQFRQIFYCGVSTRTFWTHVSSQDNAPPPDILPLPGKFFRHFTGRFHPDSFLWQLYRIFTPYWAERRCLLSQLL